MSELARIAARLRTNDVRTGAAQAYPDLQPLDLPLAPDRTYAAALAAAREMPRWRIVAERPALRAFDAEARTRLLGFVDDVRVVVTDAGGARSRVDVRSASRVGTTDFGTNARRIRDYLGHLARRIGATN